MLKEDNTEVEIRETVDYGETDMRAVLESDMKGYRRDEDFAKGGYSTQEFDASGELVDVYDDLDEDYFEKRKDICIAKYIEEETKNIEEED